MKKRRPTKAKERQKQGAKRLLARMRPLNSDDSDEAHRIKAELEKIAEHGYEREITVRVPRDVAARPVRKPKKK
jgi:hypothetical protein